MAEYLELVQTILEEKEGPATWSAIWSPDTTIFLLNEVQCKHLWCTIRAVYNYLSSSQLPAPHNERHKYLPNIFREFYVLVTRANAIEHQFGSRHSWLQAAILQGDHQLAFKELIENLQACVRIFADNANHVVSLDTSARIWRQDVDMKGDGQRDAENLRNRLNDLLARPALGEEERLLVEYLLERMSSTVDNQDVDLPQFFTSKSGYPTTGRPIGKGASGAVLQVKWLGMTCAMKHFSTTVNKKLAKKCLEEVSVLAKLNHPHIVKLLCTNVQSEVSFLMELMPMSLSDFIEKRWSSPGGIVPAAAIDMMLQIALGMEYLHEQGIVHRDLKSANILVAPSVVEKFRDLGYADLKLTDFGLAKMKVHDLTNPSGKKRGTPRWMAPEVHVADRAIDWKKADAYSFAIMCSEILTGRTTPFSSGLLGELCTRIMRHERPKLPSSCPKDLVLLLENCWDTKPSIRPSFKEIRETLTSVKADFLKFEWNDRYPRNIVKNLEGPYKYVAKHLRSVGDYSPHCSPGLLCLRSYAYDTMCYPPPDDAFYRDGDQ